MSIWRNNCNINTQTVYQLTKSHWDLAEFTEEQFGQEHMRRFPFNQNMRGPMSHGVNRPP